LGAIGSRPEKELGEGPDDLWLWPEISFVMEAKNENQDSLHKKDGAQLLSSIQWFKKTYPARKDPVPVVVANVTLWDLNAQFPNDTRVITQEKIMDLLNALEAFFNQIIFKPLFASGPKMLAGFQQSLNLTPGKLVSHFTTKSREFGNKRVWEYRLRRRFDVLKLFRLQGKGAI
jgi:hypothetical protein